jgi:uncharacterized membrane protein YtjA (UPF0391 family)
VLAPFIHVSTDIPELYAGSTKPSYKLPFHAEFFAKEETMLSLTVTLLIIAIIAAILGFGGLAGTAVGFAKIAFFVFIILALLSFVFRGGRGSVA